MSLSLIVGPPNSGRAGRIRERFADAVGLGPVLVVPTRDDVERFERELCAGPGAVVGGAVCTFPWLFEDVARAAGADQDPTLTRAQRLALIRVAVRDTELRVLRASSGGPGFAPALDSLLGELQAAGVDPRTLTERASALDDSAYEIELARLYSAYCELRDGLGRGDRHSLGAAATAALLADPDSWDRRPVLLYGFDDLTPGELELLRALASATDVTVAVTYEDRAALAARAGLLGQLRDELGAGIDEELGPNPAYTDSPTLFHIERHLFEPRPDPVEPDDGLVLLQAAGERSEAEHIGGQIARLLADGTPPDGIAVVLRRPERLGPLYDQVLSGLGVPAAVDARIPVSRTATGRGLLALLRGLFASRRADDLLTFLRTPDKVRPDQADWLERDVRRDRLNDFDDARAAWNVRVDWEPDELDELASAQPAALAGAVAGIARRIAERPYRRAAARPGRLAELELRAASEISTAVTEIAELGVLGEPQDLIETIEALAVPLWRGPTQGRVRVLSPYRARAHRVSHLFVASLQEGEFPSHSPGEPLLPDERRSALGLLPRRDPEDEERYLFYSCASRPTTCLHLSWRTTEEDGSAAPPSPFVDDVRDLLAAREPAGGSRRRDIDMVVFAPGDAPTVPELTRALAALGAGVDHARVLEELRVSDEVAVPILERLSVAGQRASTLPGPLEVPAVLAALGERELFGASTLEEYALCSYRWFVGHELRPQTLEPAPEPLTQGGILHQVLERLYREPPGADAMPRPADLDSWLARGHELVAEVAEERGLTLDDAFGRVARHRISALLDGFLASEAESDTVLRPDPELLEARFGAEEEDARGPLPLDGFGLHGQIDRIDVAPGAERGLVEDYKLGAKVPGARKLEHEAKLQLQLYMLALRELWGIEPLGAVYRPLSARDPRERRPRGPLRGSERDGLLEGLDAVATDMLDDAELDEVVERARERAVEIVELTHQGQVDRDPLRDTCPRWCRFQPICRRERSAIPESSDSENGEG
jgi:ATP-dependent helicase/DNAse subunit B